MTIRTEYGVERTPIGLQYVIPGTERISTPRPERASYSVEGLQLVIPGTEKITMRELAERKMVEPLKPRRPQFGLAGTALFGSKK